MTINSPNLPAAEASSLDMPAVRERIALAAHTLDVDASHILSMSGRADV